MGILHPLPLIFFIFLGEKYLIGVHTYYNPRLACLYLTYRLSRLISDKNSGQKYIYIGSLTQKYIDT